MGTDRRISRPDVHAHAMAGVSVEQILSLPVLDGTNVIAGQRGLHRVIRHVTVLEIPPPLDWLRGGELVLTTFFCVRDSPEGQEQVMRAMDAAGAAAIGFHPGHLGAQIPPRILDLANELDLPVLRLPDPLNYSDVIDPILMEILSRQGPEPEAVQQMRNALTRGMLSGAGLQKILERFLKDVPCTALIVDRSGRVRARGSHYVDPAASSAVMQLLPSVPRFLEAFAGSIRSDGLDEPRLDTDLTLNAAHDVDIIPIVARDDVGGFVLSVRRRRSPFRALHVLLLRELAVAAALVLTREDETAALQQSLEQDFLDLLLRVQPSTESVLLDRAARLGWTLAGPRQAVVLEVHPTGHAADGGSGVVDRTSSCRLRELRLAILAAAPGIGVVQAHDHLLCFPRGEGDLDSDKARERLCRFLEELDRGLSRGEHAVELLASIGPRVDRVAELRLSYERALHARTIRRRFGLTRPVVFSDDLAVYDLLHGFASMPDVRRLHRLLIRPILDHDQQRGTDLFSTLTAFVRNDRQLQKTADARGLHVNTVRNHLRRIEQIANVDLRSGEYLLALELCVRLHASLSGCSVADSP